MEVKHTERGFARIEFTDFGGHRCSLQQSSLAGPECIWLGSDDPDPQVLVPGADWQRVPFPPGILFHTRMHLTREQVADLLPHLQRFVEMGELSTEEAKDS